MLPGVGLFTANTNKVVTLYHSEVLGSRATLTIAFDMTTCLLFSYFAHALKTYVKL